MLTQQSSQEVNNDTHDDDDAGEGDTSLPQVSTGHWTLDTPVLDLDLSFTGHATLPAPQLKPRGLQ